ncbi:MAG TPA: flagellar basal-body rod protein FlgF [Terriglobales bacterium]|nr:flagellar basal-body rod protein FlgF [Terriglobales bacterium]
MNSGYYAACAGLQAQSQALELTANNLANLNTTGYRAQNSLFRSLLANAVAGSADPLSRVVNNFNLLGGSQTDLRAGNLERTGNPLDLAIEGKGFFVVQTSAGTLYTRDGNFQVSKTGRLTTSSGDPVLGEDGPMIVPAGTISISPDGTLSSDGAVAGKLRVVEFAPGSSPIPNGKSYYSAPKAQVRLAVDSNVREGMLESSNVNPVESLVDLISIQRRAEMLQRAMSAFSSNFDHIAASDLPRI